MTAIESNSDTLNGLLVFKGTRVPVRNLFDYLLAETKGSYTFWE